MSTRCQVQVIQEGLSDLAGGEWEDKVTLYHHSDGYPSYMLPKIKEAFDKYGVGWEAGRAGKVASFLCAVDPGEFEPEDSHELHDDIEYYYVLHVVNSQGGSMAEQPQWLVTVYKPRTSNIGQLLLGEPLIERMSIEEAVKEEVLPGL